MEEAKGFQSSKSAAQQVSKILHEIIWLRFVDFKYHLPYPNPDQPSHGENFRLLEQISFSLSPLVLLGTWWETVSYPGYHGLPNSQQRRKGTTIIPKLPIRMPASPLPPHEYLQDAHASAYFKRV